MTIYNGLLTDFLKDLFVNLKSNFGKGRRYRSLCFIINCRLKDVHGISRQKHAPIVTYDNFKNWWFNDELLQTCHISLKNLVFK